MSTFYTTPEEVAMRLTESLNKDMEQLIKRELMKGVDVIVSRMARDLAKATSSLIIAKESRQDTLSPKIQVNLIFNNKLVESYVEEEKYRVA